MAKLPKFRTIIKLGNDENSEVMRLLKISSYDSERSIKAEIDFLLELPHLALENWHYRRTPWQKRKLQKNSSEENN